MSDRQSPSRWEACYDRVIADLLGERCSSGHWEGALSSSALSTATAITALAILDRSGHQTDSQRLQQAGLEWLASHVNQDGGWGDTPESVSNISTTTLVWAAFAALKATDSYPAIMHGAEAWITKQTQDLSPHQLAQAISARYGKDRTFSVPILAMCAIAGRLGQGKGAWDTIANLPFELAALPPAFYSALKLPVVSYALPALIAIGQVKHHHAPSSNPLLRLLREACRIPTLKRLKAIQPKSGGFLEATPLTSFVVMSLAASDQAHHPVAQDGARFLKASVREDGSWPIDTHLATWVSSLAIHGMGGEGCKRMGRSARDGLCQWYLDQQYLQTHPYTQAKPGGWAWTPLSGGVPDADDTPGALIALHQLTEDPASLAPRAELGVRWLLELQNRDGGMPTFCRGWGHLPFDRSSADITAHVMRAWQLWRPHLGEDTVLAMNRATQRALTYLYRTQNQDGSWDPLWFGNQHLKDENNPLYGTAKVVEGCLSVVANPLADPAMLRAIDWLLAQQNDDGGWGATRGLPNTIEESSLALSSLAQSMKAMSREIPRELEERLKASLQRGADWLCERIENQAYRKHAPIGFYFAKLWYHECLYPMVYTAAAMRALHAVQPTIETS